MSSKTRQKLKKLFSNGRMPSQMDFYDLIDSSINPIDDGFNITVKSGVEVAPTQAGVFASVYPKKGYIETPKWKFTIDSNEDHLLLKNRVGQGLDDALQNEPSTDSDDDDMPALSVSGSKGRIGVNKALPEYTLDVDGIVAAKARVGVYKTGLVDADGDWHDILTGLQGCNMFEIVAGVSGSEKQGRYALLKAVAMNCYNPDFLFSWFRKRIKHHHAWYFSQWEKIKLRWRKDGYDKYKLQMKTVRNFKTGKTNYQIKYYVTQLWTDNGVRYSYNDGEE